MSASAPAASVHAAVAQSGVRLGILIPCRDEARVIERRIANLALSRWPASERPHALVVVDDHSTDGTLELARKSLAKHFGGRSDVDARAVESSERPGKSGAIVRGLAELDGRCDVIVLTDADVCAGESALAELARAFEGEPALGMACGAQVFVKSLAADGLCQAEDWAPLERVDGRYDRWTAKVRAFESRSGRLFSVHGQLLAWRASLALVPAHGIAADDLDLMWKARSSGACVRLVPAARFFEVKPPAGPEREQQALRRARAFLQCMPTLRAGPKIDALSRLQLALYRYGPRAAPWATLALALLTVSALVALMSAEMVLIAALLLTLTWRLGRGFASVLRTIARAGRAQAAQSLTDRWETLR